MREFETDKRPDREREVLRDREREQETNTFRAREMRETQ